MSRYDCIQDNPELIAICEACWRKDCVGECAEYINKFRELAGLPPIEKKPGQDKPAQHRLIKLYEAFGESRPLKEWAKISGVEYETLRARLKIGMGIEEALTKEVRSGPRKMLSYNGETMCISDWAKKAGIPCATLQSRLSNGETLPHALRETKGMPKKRKPKKGSCERCEHHIGGGYCRLNLEGECREGGGYEAFIRARKGASDGRNH